jgi:beta-glucosidase
MTLGVHELVENISENQDLVSHFPTDFIFGLSTAAYQIEGAASEGGRGPSIWDNFSHTKGLTRNGDNGDIACDHYHRWESDLDLLKELGVGGYRFSLSWSRLQPLGDGPLNIEAVDFYRKLLLGLRARNIKPLVTLYHWDLPQALEDQGGWPTREIAFKFAEYVALVLVEFGTLAQDWITINEPWCVSFLGYGYGAHAPGKRNLPNAVAAAHHLNLAHGLAVRKFREFSPSNKVGISNLITDIHAATEAIEDAQAVSRLDAVSNRLFLDPVYLGDYSQIVRDTLKDFDFESKIHDGDLEIIATPTDFVGINHYQRVIAWASPGEGAFELGETPAPPATTALGWSIIPDSLHDVLIRVAREYTKLPIYITESGACFEDYIDPNGEILDEARVSYFVDYLRAAGRAISEGVNLKGYFAWSFLDNFEWAEGYSKRFGLVYVDYRTQERIPKKSAKWYRKLVVDHRNLHEKKAQEIDEK